MAKLAELVNMATNYLGLIENGKKFPSAKMIERLAVNLEKDSIDLFAITPIQYEWRKTILSKINKVINEELDDMKQKKKPQ